MVDAKDCRHDVERGSFVFLNHLAQVTAVHEVRVNQAFEVCKGEVFLQYGLTQHQERLGRVTGFDHLLGDTGGAPDVAEVLYGAELHLARAVEERVEPVANQRIQVRDNVSFAVAAKGDEALPDLFAHQVHDVVFLETKTALNCLAVLLPVVVYTTADLTRL